MVGLEDWGGGGVGRRRGVDKQVVGAGTRGVEGGVSKERGGRQTGSWGWR